MTELWDDWALGWLSRLPDGVLAKFRLRTALDRRLIFIGTPLLQSGGKMKMNDPLIQTHRYALGDLSPALPIVGDMIPEENDDEIIGQILTRREALATVGRAGLGLTLLGGLAASGLAHTEQALVAKTPALVATPAVTEGPFFVDEKKLRSNLVVDAGGRESVTKGHPLTLKAKVFKIYGSKVVPFQGLYFDVWHADALGVYSDEEQGMNADNTKGLTYLRGYQITDKEGAVEFQTIWPGWYNGRTPHIHFMIRGYDAKGNRTGTLTSQFFFDDKVSDALFESNPTYKARPSGAAYNRNDNVYSGMQADGTPVGSHLMLNVNKGADHSVASFNIGLVVY